MAAAVSAWAKPGAWALDSEEHESELLQQTENIDNGVSTQPLAEFPSLAAATKPKKKKGQTVSLAEFATYGGPKPSQPSPSDALTHEDLMVLPTGPRQRTAEELERERSRGFRSYGAYDRGGEESSNSRWGSSRVSDESRRSNSFGRDARDPSREMAPSRADEIDDWAAAKKSPIGNEFVRGERREKGGFFDSHSKADESDSWVSNKSFLSSEGRKFGTNGGGFERERKVGFGSSGGADSDNWNKKKGEYSSGSERSETATGRPRLVLQPRSLPMSNGDQEGSANLAKPKGPNPFGEARPREEVLAEKGQDWKKIDEQLETVKIKEPVEKRDSFGKRDFGAGSRRSSLPDAGTERSWRKAESDDSHSQSAEKVENQHTEEN
ncbi:hypothetical protein L6164_033307 [Bauhinia variegata]|uniref:Uncharacterized protein n=1 Tax=Bauhinia variegata TaxID=167791 RepID=A0ACB9KRK7_BAUVA|nr:hypothetical protein L6164_033307 [Bauhinia variegata]